MGETDHSTPVSWHSDERVCHADLPGENPAPDVENWGILFIDGLKLIIVGLVYAIPVFIIMAITYGSIILAALSGNTGRMNSAMISGWSPNLGLVLLMLRLRSSSV